MNDGNDTQVHATDETPVALVTGAARRIGRAIALRLHADGYRVIVHAHNSTTEAAALVEQLNQQRADSATCLLADLTDASATAELAQQALRQHGRIDLLVNNASSFYPTPLTSMADDGTANDHAWNDLMGSNLRAPMMLASQLAPALKQAGGSIVNIIDIHADSALAHHHIYCAAKAGLASLTRNLALSLGPQARANAVAPGAILWPETNPDSVAAEKSIRDGTALQRMGEPDDIAAMVAFLASADAAYITGQAIAVDGGRRLYQY